MRKLFPTAQEHLLMAVARDGKIAAAMDEIRAVLRQERHVPFSEPDNFFMSTADQM